jgi:hypothetical protein
LDKEAKVRVGVEGAEEVGGAAAKAIGPWKSAGAAVATSFRSAGHEVGQQLQQIGSDMLRTVTVMRTLSLHEAVVGAREYREEVTKFGVAANTSVAAARSQFEKVSKQTLVGEQQLISWSKTVGRLTYSYTGAVASAKSLHDESLATGKSFDEMGQLGVTLNQGLGVTGDMGAALGKIRAQAEALGTVGGVSAFQDQIQQAADSMVGLADATDEQRDTFTALMGVVGKGLAPRQAAAAQRGVQGFVEQNATMAHLLGGVDIYDEMGKLDPKKEAQALRFLRDKYRKLMPNKDLRIEAERRAMGPLAAAAFERGDFSDKNLQTIAGVKPSGGAEQAAQAYDTSKAGRAEAVQLEAARHMRDAGEKMVEAGDKFQSIFAAHPILGSAAGGVVQALAGTVLSRGAGALGGLFGGGAAGVESVAAGEGAAAVASTSIASLGAAALSAAGPIALIGGSAYAMGFAMQTLMQKLGYLGTTLDKPETKEARENRLKYTHARTAQIKKTLDASWGEGPAPLGSFGGVLGNKKDKNDDLMALAAALKPSDVDADRTGKSVADQLALRTLRVQVVPGGAGGEAPPVERPAPANGA